MEIAPGISGIDFQGRVWAYVVAESDTCTLIDTGIGGELNVIIDGLGEAEYRPQQVRQIILTHCHKDHAGLAAELKRVTDAALLAHSLDTPMVEGDTDVADPQLSGREKAIVEQLSGSIPDAEPAEVDAELEDGDEIEIGGEGAKVIHLPGHTPGSIGLFLPATRVLFTGDAAASLSGRPVTGFFNIEPDEARRSFAKLSEVEFEMACFGHGAPLLKRASLAFRREAERLALTG